MKYEANKSESEQFFESSREQTAGQFGVTGLPVGAATMSRVGKKIPGKTSVLDKMRKSK
jgi:hypothetical protein